jgi:hypothetical protein
MSQPLHDFSPWGVFTPTTLSTRADVTLVCGASSITLPLPIFGNSEAVDVKRALNTSRGGTPNIFREPTWPETTEVSISFQVLTRAKALELLDFFKDCLGLLVTYTDPYDRDWEGVITNPDEAVIDGGDCKYSASLTLAANPV